MIRAKFADSKDLSTFGVYCKCLELVGWLAAAAAAVAVTKVLVGAVTVWGIRVENNSPLASIWASARDPKIT